MICLGGFDEQPALPSALLRRFRVINRGEGVVYRAYFYRTP